MNKHIKGGRNSYEAQRKKHGKGYSKFMSDKAKIFWESERGKKRRELLSTPTHLQD